MKTKSLLIILTIIFLIGCTSTDPVTSGLFKPTIECTQYTAEQCGLSLKNCETSFIILNEVDREITVDILKTDKCYMRIEYINVPKNQIIGGGPGETFDASGTFLNCELPLSEDGNYDSEILSQIEKYCEGSYIDRSFGRPETVITESGEECTTDYAKDPSAWPTETCGAVCFRDYGVRSYNEEPISEGSSYVYCFCDLNDCGGKKSISTTSSILAETCTGFTPLQYQGHLVTTTSFQINFINGEGTDISITDIDFGTTDLALPNGDIPINISAGNSLTLYPTTDPTSKAAGDTYSEEIVITYDNTGGITGKTARGTCSGTIN